MDAVGPRYVRTIMRSIPESHLELVSQPLGCVITTIAPSGLPQSTGMWFLFDDGKIRFSLLEHRRKYRNLRANAACTFFLMSPKSMIETIEVRGAVTFEPDPDKTFVTRVRAQYGAVGPPSDGPDDVRWIVTIEPDRINTTGRG
jgi:PPOX class probable F420-dependent enzyme